MKHKTWTAVLAIVVVAILIWLFCNRETTEWLDEVPHCFKGSWKLVEDYYSDNYGIRSIRLLAHVIVLDKVLDENEKEARQFPIRKISITARKGSQAGSLIIFYGPADDETIAKRRLQIYFGSKQKITVQEIVPTGWGEDRWFDVGEFVKVK